MNKGRAKVVIEYSGSTKVPFNWEDPLDLESGLTEEERMVRDTARDYAQEQLFPRVLEAYRHETTDPGMMQEMGSLGLLGPTIPRNMAARVSVMSPMA